MWVEKTRRVFDFDESSCGKLSHIRPHLDQLSARVPENITPYISGRDNSVNPYEEFRHLRSTTPQIPDDNP